MGDQSKWTWWYRELIVLDYCELIMWQFSDRLSGNDRAKIPSFHGFKKK